MTGLEMVVVKMPDSKMFLWDKWRLRKRTVLTLGGVWRLCNTGKQLEKYLLGGRIHEEDEKSCKSYFGKNEDYNQETALRNCEKWAVWNGHSDSFEKLLQRGRGKVTTYVILVEGENMQSSTYFCRRFLLVTWTFWLSPWRILVLF